MPWSWPAEVTYYEAKAFAKWKAEQDQVEGTPEEYRLLTEAEHHCLRHSTTTTTPSTQLESSSSSTDSNDSDSNINQQVCNIADNENNCSCNTNTPGKATLPHEYLQILLTTTDDSTSSN